MSKRDFYEVLGVERSADADTIKKSYRRLAMKYHPDRTKGDAKLEEKFKEIQEAYACLSDEQKRAGYDRFGHEAFSEGSGMGGGSFSFDDIFSDFFGGGGGGRSQRKQQRVLDIGITFAEMATGCKKDLDIQIQAECDDCGGSGSADGSSPSTCGQCGGRGQVQARRGPFSFSQSCDRCNGTGGVIDKPCRTCRSLGKIKDKKRLSVTIPAGIEDGNLMRLSVESMGEELFLRVSVRPHPIFQRDGENLHVEIPISIITATLGGSVDIPTVAGKRLKVKIPEGVQNGQVLRVTGGGLKSLRHSKNGNLMCHITVETPIGLTEKQKQVLLEFEATLKDSHTPKGKSWLGKIKALFTE